MTPHGTHNHNICSQAQKRKHHKKITQEHLILSFFLSLPHPLAPFLSLYLILQSFLSFTHTPFTHTLYAFLSLSNAPSLYFSLSIHLILSLSIPMSLYAFLSLKFKRSFICMTVMFYSIAKALDLGVYTRYIRRGNNYTSAVKRLKSRLIAFMS